MLKIILFVINVKQNNQKHNSDIIEKHVIIVKNNLIEITEKVKLVN